ncbi:MAG: abscisic acid-deficient protein Aba4 family protein [Opitutales bacterium]
MPVWIIEFFGGAQLERAFVFLLLMTAPVWLGMILFPDNRVVRMAAQPLVMAPAYGVVLLVLLWRSHQAALIPDPVDQVSYSAARALTKHPVAFLAILCNLQILNLALGTVVYQKSWRVGIRAPVELVLCWVIGAPAALVFVARLLWRRKKFL